ncbi:DUF4395 domain-containing protein [Kineosporia sp. J2-2]|uniref:DUF4395 domain-containing protein n=1 Tax=Kineosporia corallincola TaxID=2835133 RepID=A0ABS5TAT3_9ACTN|nr:DUF4395 domain-containing protein [Kineosporia corallincola]MBT0768167.1 DUF4395 domain-containing protein [Kineosporia corallincola]
MPVPTPFPRDLIGFPNPVNEVAARTVAGGVMLLSAATLVLSLSAGEGWLWLSVPLAYGFWARVATGPVLSPLGQLATRVIAPRLGQPRLVPGPPKRFAQAIGAVVTTAVVVLTLIGQAAPAQALLAIMVLFAGLESVFAFCVGCRVFAGLMRVGLIPAETCEACNNIALRHPV